MPYIPFTDEQKQLANSVDLAEYLRVRGEKLERAGIEHKLIYYDSSGKHDSITIRGSKWFDHKNQTGGEAIKFMQEFYGMDFQTAVQELLGQRVTPLSHSPPKAIAKEEKKEFKLPEANSNMHRVYAYLIKQRFINPNIISHFAKQHTLYEDKEHHNAVFVGVDENCIAMNGVYENAVLTALKSHSNLSEIVLCVDNDEGGIEAVDRLRDILNENGYSNVKRLAPPYKDWNEVLKAKNGAPALPAVPNKHKEEYHRQVGNLQYLKCRPDKLTSQIYAAFKNEQYKYLAEYALAGSAFFIDKSCENGMFAKLRAKLKAEYKPYTDKGKVAAKQRNLQECVMAVMKDLRQTARTREQSINTAKLLYQLADRSAMTWTALP